MPSHTLCVLTLHSRRNQAQLPEGRMWFFPLYRWNRIDACKTMYILISISVSRVRKQLNNYSWLSPVATSQMNFAVLPTDLYWKMCMYRTPTFWKIVVCWLYGLAFDGKTISFQWSSYQLSMKKLSTFRQPLWLQGGRDFLGQEHSSWFSFTHTTGIECLHSSKLMEWRCFQLFAISCLCPTQQEQLSEFWFQLYRCQEHLVHIEIHLETNLVHFEPSHFITS